MQTKTTKHRVIFLSYRSSVGHWTLKADWLISMRDFSPEIRPWRLGVLTNVFFRLQAEKNRWLMENPGKNRKDCIM